MCTCEMDAGCSSSALPLLFEKGSLTELELTHWLVRWAYSITFLKVPLWPLLRVPHVPNPGTPLCPHLPESRECLTESHSLCGLSYLTPLSLPSWAFMGVSPSSAHQQLSHPDDPWSKDPGVRLSLSHLSSRLGSRLRSCLASTA